MTLLAGLRPPTADPIFALNSQLETDTRDRKLDLIVGVYRNEHGVTPVFRAVHTAEERLTEEAESKSYRGLSGNVPFNDRIRNLVFDDAAILSRATTIQSVGGTGALRLLADFIAFANHDATIWISDPGWGNHEPLFKAAGLAIRKYRYLNDEGTADGEAILAQLSEAKSGDAVLIHGCCHNPSGADLSSDLWSAIADLANERGLLPLVDLAYQGLGDGLDADVTGLRLFAGRVPEVLVSVSCSKNFGLYNERTGAAIVIGASADAGDVVTGILQSLARTNYSMPPDHGAAIVSTILGDDRLRAGWSTELASMRERILGIRVALAETFLAHTSNPALQAIRHHKGMFSLLPLSAAQMVSLRTDHAVYGTNGGRINVAGLSIDDVPYLADSVIAVLDA